MSDRAATAGVQASEIGSPGRGVRWIIGPEPARFSRRCFVTAPDQGTGATNVRGLHHAKSVWWAQRFVAPSSRTLSGEAAEG